MSDYVEAAMQAYKVYSQIRKGQDTEEYREKVIAELKKIHEAVIAAQGAIIDEVREQLRSDLEGDVEGLAVRFSSYNVYDKEKKDEYDKWETMGKRLLNIVDNSAGVIADFETNLKRLNEDTDKNFKFNYNLLTWYGTVVFLRAAAMVEHARTYGIPDDKQIPPMLTKTNKIANLMLDRLKKREENIFGNHGQGVTLKPYRERAGQFLVPAEYRFDGELIYCDSVKVSVPGDITGPLSVSQASSATETAHREARRVFEAAGWRKCRKEFSGRFPDIITLKEVSKLPLALV